MYSSPEDARSDLFLAAAVFLFGPLILDLLLGILPLPNLRLLDIALGVALPLAVTVLLPWYLIRYRREPLSAYGLGAFQSQSFGVGVLVAVPLIVASMFAMFVGSDGAVVNPLRLTTSGGLPMIASRLAHAIGRCLLALYVTVKARDAFRQDYMAVRDGLREIGRWIVIVSAASLGLLILGALVRGQGLNSAVYLLMPFGLVGAFALAMRSLRGPSVTSRQVLLTPTILLALGPFALSLSGPRLLASLYEAALWGGVGLLVGVLTETKRGGWSAVGLGGALAALTIFQTF